MNKRRCLIKILMLLAIALGIFFLGSQVKAGSILLNHLDFQITLNEDGSMNVTENLDARINDTNTMFKDFKMDSSKFKEITDVKVYRVHEDNTKTKLTEIDEEMYHVTKDCYYGLINSNGDFEIAWGVSVDKTEYRNYQIQYKVIDAVKNYEDCSEFYWQLVGDENSISVNHLTATIFLPKKVTDKNNLRAWAHGPYNGNIALENDKVTLELDYLDPGIMVEARVVTTENLFPEAKTLSTSKLNTILAEEQRWADEANAQRQAYIEQRQWEEKMEAIWEIVRIILGIAISVFAIFKFIMNLVKAGKIPKKQEPFIQYFRDIPDETASSGDAAFLYYFKNGSFSKNISKVLSATLLQLALKKYIAFSVDNTGKKPDVRVNLLDYSDHIDTMPPLKKDEQTVYQLLTKVSKEKTFTMKEFEKYAEKHSSTFMNQINKIQKQVLQEQNKLQNYNSKNTKEISNHSGFATLYIVFGVFVLINMTIPGILLLLNCIPHFMMKSKLNTLTDKGLEEAAKWKGLKRYMEDFSLLDEKQVPDLVLWEKYLVFATAFGIADKVLKQLKVKYPELQQIDGYEYTYMNLLYHSSLNTAFLTSLNTSVNKVYMGGLSAQAASSGYSGGNFSSGGGRRRWILWRRWPAEEAGGRNGRKIK